MKCNHLSEAQIRAGRKPAPGAERAACPGSVANASALLYYCIIPLTKWHLLFLQEVSVIVNSHHPYSHANLKCPEARPAPKPQPIGSFPFILLLTTATVCVLFIIWRRSDTLRTVVAHQCVQASFSQSHLVLELSSPSY